MKSKIQSENLDNNGNDNIVATGNRFSLQRCVNMSSPEWNFFVLHFSFIHFYFVKPRVKSFAKRIFFRISFLSFPSSTFFSYIHIIEETNKSTHILCSTSIFHTNPFVVSLSVAIYPQDFFLSTFIFRFVANSSRSLGLFARRSQRCSEG